jgi:hypothetical protein
MSKEKILKFEKAPERRSVELVSEGPFFVSDSQIENRQIARATNKQALIHNWLRAHNHVMQFRREFETNKKRTDSDELRFWYGTSNRIVVALDLVFSVLEELQPSINSIAKNTGLTRQTVAKIIQAAQEGGFVDAELVPSAQSQKLMADQVYALVGGAEFLRFAKSVMIHDAFATAPLR